jgi:hypothetical protein
MKSLADTITPEEVRRAKDQLKGNLVIGWSPPAARCRYCTTVRSTSNAISRKNDIMKAVEADHDRSGA